MSTRPLPGLSTEPYLLADICGHLVIAGCIVSVLILTELANRLVGPVTGLVFLFVFASLFVAVAMCAKRRTVEFFDRFLGWANSLFPTPGLLQRGYTCIESRSVFVHLSLYGLLALLIFFHPLLARMSDSGGAEKTVDSAGSFVGLLIAVFSVYVILIGLLLLASLVAGYMNRRAEHH